jgi:O-antigen ligase
MEAAVSVQTIASRRRFELAAKAAAAQLRVLQLGAALLPLVYWPWTYDSYVLPKLLLARSLVLVLAALLVIRWMAGGAIVVKRTPLDLPLLAFITSALISAIAGVNLNVGLFGTYTRYDGVLTLITYAALFWLAVQTLKDTEDARSLLRAMLIGAYFVAILAIGQWLLGKLHGEETPRAYGTLGNANVLGAYLAMLMGYAYYELSQARSAGGRLIAANSLAIIGLALLLTLSHSAWLGLFAGALILIAGGQFRVLSRRWQIASGVMGLLILAAAAPIVLNRSTDLAQRAGIWTDSLRLIASRPILGFGPDTVGLVFPRFQTAPWVSGYVQIDKAHSELLQVAATQGLVGLAIFIWICAVFVMAFWGHRGLPVMWPLFAGWAAYQVVIWLNFTAIGSAFSFWIFAAASIVLMGATEEKRMVPALSRAPAAAAGTLAAVALVALAFSAVVLPYLADSSLRDAVAAQHAQRPSEAAAPAARARDLNPQESVYAAEAGNLAFANQDFAAARAAYLDAVRLGTFSPRLYRNLAITDSNLGLRSEAIAAAQQAVYLDPFDPANQALLAQMSSSAP